MNDHYELRTLALATLHLLTQQAPREAVHIADDDMIYITWRHLTLRLNVTGLLYLVDFLHGDHTRKLGFEVYGTPDDGYEIWVQDAGLRLSPADSRRFQQMLSDSVNALRQRGKHGDSAHLPDCLKLTVAAQPAHPYSHN